MPAFTGGADLGNNGGASNNSLAPLDPAPLRKPVGFPVISKFRY
jgi:hypothetical protein